MSSRRLVYHYPVRIGQEASGSQVHINQMLAAFKRLGWQVTLIAGPAAKRQSEILKIRAEDEQRGPFEFVYSWAPLIPSLMGRGNQTRPLVDLNFFRWCKSRRLPVGLFYGDVHWRFDHYRRNVNLARYLAALPLFHYDWQIYRRYVDYLFLPSLKMADYLPSAWPAKRLAELYPGCHPAGHHSDKRGDDRSHLNVFYVGGVTPPLYDLRQMVKTIGEMNGIRLTLCCREEEWAKVRTYYEPFNRANIRIIHAHGPALEDYYAEADIFGLYWRPYPYLGITMPVKVMEALGYGTPILTTMGTVAADFVAEQKIGWVVSNDEEFRAQLESLRADREEIQRMSARCREICVDHTWDKRAELVADILTDMKEVDCKSS